MIGRNLGSRLAALEAHVGAGRARVSSVAIGGRDGGTPWPQLSEAAWLLIYAVKEADDAKS